MNVKLFLQCATGLAGYLAWAIYAHQNPMEVDAFLQFNKLMVFGTIGLLLRDMPPK